MSKKYYPQAVHLPETLEQDDSLSDAKIVERKPMTGWSILYMWIPAICDLAGTAVSIHCLYIFLRSMLNNSNLCDAGPLYLHF